MFEFKSFQKIVASQVAYITANSPLNDVNAGSTILTMIEAVSQEIYQQYIQLVNVIQSYNLETTTGEDLDNRALEYGLERNEAKKSSGYITISDESFTKVSTNVFAGTGGAVAGQATLDIDDSTGFLDPGGVMPIGGWPKIIVGRSAGTEQTIEYTDIVSHTTYYTVMLNATITGSHKIGESIIYSQRGLRSINSGSVVYVPQTNISDRIDFILNETATLADGEDETENILVTANIAGIDGNIPLGSIDTFETTPFVGAIVENPESFTNGTDIETDSELQDRIRNTIQSLSKGTALSIITLLSGITNSEETKRVVSSNLIEPVSLSSPTRVYIDDGVGFEPTFSGKATEYVIRTAAGTEKFLQLDNYPIVKASLLTNNSQPYAINSGDKLIVAVNDVEETIIFGSTDFTTVGVGTAREVAVAINDRMSLIEARTASSNNKIIISALANTNEKIKIVTPGTGVDANDVLNFDEDKYAYTLNLYKNDVLLNKDGLTAFVDTANTAPYDLSGAPALTLEIDNKTTNPLSITFAPASFLDPTVATTDEVAAAINAELPGGYAISILDDSKVRVYSRTANEADSYIEITGGVANTILGFPTAQVQGADVDYVLNRNNGQIELTDSLIEDDVVTAGTVNTEAFLECVSPQNYPITVGVTDLAFYIDGEAVAQVITFAIASYTAEQIADLINDDKSLIGVHAYTIERGTDTYLRIATNTLDGSGTIEVDGTLTTAITLDFAYNTLSTSEEPNSAYIEPDNEEDYVLGPDQNLVVILDGDASDRVLNLIFSLEGTVTNAGGLATFDSTNVRDSYSNDNDFFNGYYIRFQNATTTPALRGYARFVSDYVGASGGFVLADDLPAAPVSGDVFDISPVTADNIVYFLNNTLITPFSIYTDVRLIKEGVKPQIATTTAGSAGGIQIPGGSANNILTPFVSDGTSGGDFEINSPDGLFYGVGDALPSAIAIAEDLRTQTNAHAADAAQHTTAIDNVNFPLASPAAVALPSLIVLVTEMLTSYDAHDADAELGIGWAYHAAQETADHSLASAVAPTTLHECVIRLNDIKTKYNAHDADSTCHGVGGSHPEARTLYTYCGGLRIKIDNALNTYTYSFVTDGLIGGTFTCGFARYLQVGEGIVLKDDDSITYLNGYVNDITAAGFLTLGADGQSDGSFVTGNDPGPLGAGLTVGDYVVINDNNTNAYTDGYIYSYTQAGAPYTVVIYDGRTLEPFDLSAYTLAQVAVCYYSPFTIDVYDRTTGAAYDIRDFTVAQNAKVSSVYDKGYIQNIAADLGTGAEPYTVTIYDEDSLAAVGTLETYTTDYGAVLKDRHAFNFNNNAVVGVDGYKYYIGLLREVQWKLDGLDSDPLNYPGIKAVGATIEVASPVVRPIRLSIDITTQGDITIGSIDSNIKNAIIQYVNNLKVGEDVLLSGVECAVKEVSGVYDVSIISPAINVIISSNELARILSSDITLI